MPCKLRGKIPGIPRLPLGQPRHKLQRKKKLTTETMPSEPQRRAHSTPNITFAHLVCPYVWSEFSFSDTISPLPVDDGWNNTDCGGEANSTPTLPAHVTLTLPSGLALAVFARRGCKRRARRKGPYTFVAICKS